MFDKVVLIHMGRRTDRLDQFQTRNWPLGKVEIFNAIDGRKTGVPPQYLKAASPGAWGCLRSHVSVLEQALMEGCQSVLVLEDDVCWQPDLQDRLGHFMKVVPENWQQLMLGGEHIAQPIFLTKDVVRCHFTIRAHAYAMRATAIPGLLRFLYGCVGHLDQCMAHWQKTHNSYAPFPFLIGQAGSKSDVSGQEVQENYWNGSIVVPAAIKKIALI